MSEICQNAIHVKSVWKLNVQNVWQVVYNSEFAWEKHNFFDTWSNHNSILTLWWALNHPSSPLFSFQQFHLGRPDPQGLHHGQQSKFDYKETKDLISMTRLHVLLRVNTITRLSFDFLPVVQILWWQKNESSMLISEHVVFHQTSDWGDNINSSQMC